ncbi:hypothetical protein TRVL_08015 [Trypanosoma vivax]|nr:hypothetical protein TRVL_08015 [Trypanosoma vivax]
MAGHGAKRTRRWVAKCSAPRGATARRSTRVKTETEQRGHVAITCPDEEHVDDSGRSLIKKHDVLCSLMALVERKIEQLKGFEAEQRDDTPSRLIYEPIYLQNKRFGDVLSASTSPVTTELTFVKLILPQKDLHGLRVCVSLRKLSIVGCSCSSGLAPLFALASLEELSLLRTRPVVSVDGIHELPRLRVLDLSETAVDTVCVRALSECKNLVSLFMRSCMCEADCSDLVKIRTLEELDMSDSHFKANVCVLLCLPHLRVLHGPKTCSHPHDVPAEVSCTKLRTFSAHNCVSLPIVELSKMKELEEVSFSYCGLKTRDVVNLARLLRLRILSICREGMDDSTVRLLGKCSFLEKLNLSFSRGITDVSPLVNVLTLEELDLSYCSCVEKGAGDLGRLPHLRILNLKHTRVTDSCLVGLGTSRSLVRLDLSFIRSITDITPVLGIATLEELNVLYNGEVLSKRYDFSRLQNLRGLSLWRAGRLEHVKHFSAFPSGLTRLSLRCVGTLNITPSFIKKTQTLVELELNGDKICTNFDELSKLPHLRTLSLCSYKFPYDVKFLSKCTTVIKLFLGLFYYPTDLLPLEHMKSLKELHIAVLKLLPGGVIGIPPLLRDLKLSDCIINDGSFKIPEYNGLECLNISNCNYIDNLSFMRKMKRLERFFFSDYSEVRYGLEALSELPFLRHISTTRKVLPYYICSTLREKGVTVIENYR